MNFEYKDRIEVVGINDIVLLEICVYFFKYDSVFGFYLSFVEIVDGCLFVEGRGILFIGESDFCVLDFVGVDVVMECMGKVDMIGVVCCGLEVGVLNVFIFGLLNVVDIMLVMGVNEGKLDGYWIVFNGLCMINVLVLFLCGIDNVVGVEVGYMIIIYCYIGS